VFLDVFSSVSALFLVCIGLWLSYGMLRIINLAHGELIMLGAYVASVFPGTAGGFWLSVLAAGLVVGMVGLIMERAVLRRLYDRRDFSSLLATWGLGLLMSEGVRLLFGPAGRYVETPVVGTFTVYGAVWPQYRALLCLVAGLSFAAFYTAMRFSRFGLIVRATIEEPTRAERLGIDSRKVRRLVFIASCFFTGAGGALIAPLSAITPYMGSDYTMRSFFAVITGGMSALSGPLMGAILVGGSRSWLSSIMEYSLATMMSYLFVLAVILLRPNGLSTLK
jgi:branched-subunit amino acid ABC-type transport system permease component